MKINIKKTNQNAVIPTRGYATSAGADLYACINSDTLVIAPHATEMVGTGIAVELPEGIMGAVFARSGISTKLGLRPANCVGVIDPEYRGEIMVGLHNDSDLERCISNGERIAQLVLIPFESAEFNLVDDLSDSERGSLGFGSTGNK